MDASRNLASFLHRSGSIYHIVIDLEGKYQYTNELYSKIFLSTPQSGAASFESSLVYEDLPLYREAFDECTADPYGTVCADLRRSRPDGSIFWIRWEFAAVTDQGNVVGIQGIGTDASERKRAEQEKKEVQEKLSRERYLLRTLIDHLPDAIFVKDTYSRFIITNRAQLELIGAPSEEDTIGKTVSGYIDQNSAETSLGNDSQLLMTGKAMINREEYIVNSGGERRWLLTTRVPLRDESDRIIGLVGISRDITDRKKIEESLRKSIERFDIVSRATNDAIWDWDLVTDQVLWNDAVQFLFGYERSDIEQKIGWWEKNIHPDDRTRVIESVKANIAEGIESWQEEYRFLCRDGSVKWIYDRGFILFDEQQKPYRMIGAMMDTTERRALRDELAAQQLARQKVVTEATIMAQEKERSEIGRELHDNINQILTTTKMYLDMAMNEKDISEELMLKSHENISSAIEEIRILSKSLVPPSLGDIGLKEAIREMISALNISQKLKINLKTAGLTRHNIPDNTQLMLFRIVQEQLSNVLKHAAATEAEIRINVGNEWLELIISDNGTGFDTKKRSRGIGLMNIASRAELQNGHIQIQSAPGKGCILKIFIPL